MIIAIIVLSLFVIASVFKIHLLGEILVGCSFFGVLVWAAFTAGQSLGYWQKKR